MATGAAVVGAITGVYGAVQNKKARESSAEAQKAEERRAAAQNARSRRKAIAASRRARAQTVAQGASQGISGSSAVQGAAGSAQMQGAEAVGFSRQLEQFDRQRFSALEDRNQAISRRSTAQSFNQVYQSFYDSTQ